jgi:AcrR family transcriptional regulator
VREPGRHPGRPRDDRLDVEILRCGLEVMLERGYHGASLAEIARRAGVGTPAIYRRWPTKAHLAIELVFQEPTPELIPNSGSVRDGLVAFMRLRLQTVSTPLYRQILMPVVIDGVAEGSVAAEIRERFIGYRAGLAQRIIRAIQDGELRADTDPDLLLDFLMGTITMPLLFFQDMPPVEKAEAIVDQILSGFANREVPAKPPLESAGGL